MNIDKDIERVKSIVKVHNDFLKGCDEQTISEKEIKSIEKVLGRLENIDNLAKNALRKNSELKNKIKVQDIELEIKDKIINLILGEYIDSRYSFEFIEPNKRKNKRKEVIDEYIEHYRKKVLEDV